MRKKWVSIICIGMLSLFFTRAAFAHGLVYEMKPSGDKKVKITLKWSDPKEARGITIYDYYIQNGKTLFIGYKLNSKAAKTATLEYSLLSAIPPIRVVLYKSDDASKLPFKDIKGIEAETDIRHLHDTGIIDAGKDEKFRPNDHITRAEFAELICKALKLTGTAQNTNDFTDIANVPQKNFILLAVKKGILSGDKDKKFKPGNTMTVAELCTSIHKAFTFKTVKDGIYIKLKQGMPYSAAVKKVFDVGILRVEDSIYAKFNEESKISRANTAMMVSRALSTY